MGNGLVASGREGIKCYNASRFVVEQDDLQDIVTFKNDVRIEWL